MSHLSGNPHYESSFGSLCRIEGKELSYQESENVLRGAQVTATLALAYEQRTANLIAKLALNAQMSASNRAQRPDAAKVDDEIISRLGLNEGATK